MSLDTATTIEIKDQIVALLEQSLNQNIPLLPKAFNRVFARVLAAVFILLWKYAGGMFLNQYIRTASDQETTVNGVKLTPLVELNRRIGAGDPVAAVPAEFLTTLTVNVQTGSVLSGTPLLNDDNGVTYITIGDTPLIAPTVDMRIRAINDQAGGNGAGAIGNLDIGAVASFVSTPANVAQDTIINSQETTGADAESTAAYRQRGIDRFGKRPQGGAYSDYEIWGEEAAGIINVYPYTGGTKPTSGPGQIDLYSEATPASSGSADGVPTTAQLAAVETAVKYGTGGFLTRNPVGKYINSWAIYRATFDVIVSGHTGDNLPAVEADMTTAVTEYFAEREPFIPGLSLGARTDRVTHSEVAGLCANIASAAGTVFSAVFVYEGAVLITVRSLLEGEKTKVGTVTYP